MKKTASDMLMQAAARLGLTIAEVNEIFSERGDAQKREDVEQLAAKLARETWRANYVPAPQMFLLEQACRLVNSAYGSVCYLVGSALHRRDYRDVDVRLILADEEFARAFPGITERVGSHPLWSLTCLTISEHLSKQTRLPIDFQIQQRTRANAEHDLPRSALGMFYELRPNENYPGGG